MERLYAIKTSFGAKDFISVFQQGKLIIKMTVKKELFEFGNLKTPLTKLESVYKFYVQMDSIYKMIDCLKSDEETEIQPYSA